ncbi:type I restriction endonuclease subunit R [Changpingibacter yushuensis]|uniref:type I restriction endonuclease subunit R n=1 Tax=Changpingibacter yushuensis TaxID=2758440 RepID=UPI0021CD2A46|nr:type I restriction endonuclease subunit R [Changpingibacter yushuensis]
MGHTKYYSNTTRRQHLDDTVGRKKSKKTSNSFEFTSWWADSRNKPIQDLMAFAKTFFAKHCLLNVLTKYCVLTADRSLLVMRPYQIVATERILNKILISTNYKRLGTVDAGGYVWHTTGSGKTLTSFKTAQLAAELTEVDRVLFVVDRKDLDYQTMLEYERFSPGSVNASKDTRQLARQLTSPVGAVLDKRGTETLVNRKISVTTIQKLSTFIATNKASSVFHSHVVIIFDECHRSQFGEMHTQITRAFTSYNLFGFTGTPIFSANAGSGGNPQLKTTEQAFGEKLHTYTIVDAITDKNVLPFRIDYINTIKTGLLEDKSVSSIDTEKALLDPRRVGDIVAYILEHFDQKTRRNEHYMLKDRRLRGFNSLFATASIEAARMYYNQFQLAQHDRTPDERLKVGIIYSFAPNPDMEDGILEEESFETGALSLDNRSFLEDAIQDYNDMFATSFDTSSDGFQNYYKDLSMRLKNREIDLVIVVNMFLTGFDATTLNTLWVDKNLKAHGLIQAFSRTNRILNKVKTYGNIVSFRNLEDATNDAIALFGNKDAHGIVTLKPYGDYYQDYASKVTELLADYPLGVQIVGEDAQKAFIALFGAILRLQNILASFDEFAGSELLSERQGQDYRSVYLDLYNEYRRGGEAEKEDINDDVVFEIELIKQVEINVDYILLLVQKYRDKYGDGQDKEIRAQIARAVDASPTLRSKKDLIEDFVDTISLDSAVQDEWQAFITQRQEAELNDIITDEHLKPEATHQFIDRAFHDGALHTNGTAITTILPPVSRFTKDRSHGAKKHRVINKLTTYFNRFAGLNQRNRED